MANASTTVVPVEGLDEGRDYAMEFEATVIRSVAISWTKDKDKNGQPLPQPVTFYVNKYSFVSESVNGILIEWLNCPTQPVLSKGKCKIRFRQLRPSREMFGFYELSGYPVLLQ